ncbi:MAG: DNA-binding protein [Elusimicrobia bacterium GWC2_51_8]|nr:MAG: DNA-binding protein [Elusimicrobia bacterium GWA2_51_34]OGR59553.1 MAG: DNA-binding protein [Elusimicrobia bacterium GWC2_51_8]HAF94467.1 DNA-binding protein [Elusimicrobiota bacterium]HCE98976.1 DNA-binding protein [Elusimicrobiota bacterium]
MKEIVPVEIIESKILLLRGRKVMLDRDLAALYGVATKALNQAVKRKARRFPEDFMFRLTKAEMRNWKSQFVTSNSRVKMGLRKAPCAFTQNGISMLSSVLNSERAVNVNIQIMRTFTRLMEIISAHKDLARRLDKLESKYDTQFKIVFDVIRELMAVPEKPKKRIGFTAKEKRAKYLSPVC